MAVNNTQAFSPLVINGQPLSKTSTQLKSKSLQKPDAIVPVDKRPTVNNFLPVQPSFTLSQNQPLPSLEEEFQQTIQKLDPETPLSGRRLEFTRHYDNVSVNNTQLYIDEDIAPTYTKPKSYQYLKIDSQFSETDKKKEDTNTQEAPEFLATRAFGRQLQQANPYGVTNRFRGVGLQLNELINSGEKSFSQSLVNYQFSGSDVELPHIDFSSFTTKKKDEVQSFNLALTTRSGARVNLSLKSYDGYGKTADISLHQDEQYSLTAIGKTAGFRSTEIEFSITGDLTEQEKQQISAFTDKLEKLSQGTLGNDVISGLSLAEFDAFKHVKLEGFGVDLRYENNISERSFVVNSGGNTAKITVDKNDLINTSSSGSERALEHYLELIKNAGEEAKSKQHIALMQDVFKAGFQTPVSEQSSLERSPLKQQAEQHALHPSRNTIRIDASNINTNTSTQATLNERAAQSGLIPLPDFEFSYHSVKAHPNRAKPLQEYSGFDLTLGLKTRVTERDNQTHFQQTQSYQLTAAYYQPLIGQSQPDFENQSYRYTTINQEYQKTTDILTQDGQLLSALATTTGESKTTTQTYEFGQLKDTEVDHNVITESQNLTELLLASEHQTDELLDALLLDPATINN